MRRRLLLAAYGVALLGLASFLVVRASNTGQEAFDRATATLSSASWFESAMEAATLRLRSYLNDSFDDITALQVAERGLLADLDALGPGYAPLAGALHEEARLIDDFKAQHAVFRNSFYAFQRLVGDLRASEALRNDARGRESVGQLERAVLSYAFLGTTEDRAIVERLITRLREDAGFAPIAATDDWGFVVAHVRRVLDGRPLIVALDEERAALDIKRKVGDQLAGAQAVYSATVARARYHLYALFALALMLVVVAIWEIAQVRHYVAVVEKHGRGLEARVAERTADLATANDRLRQDAVERERMQEDLLQARKLESVGQLAAGVAHEINTPIQFIGDNIRFLDVAFKDLSTCLTDIRAGVHRSTPLSGLEVDELLQRADTAFIADEAPRAIAQSLDGVDRVREIVLAMKAFAHPSDNVEPADLNTAIKNAITMTRSEWKFVATAVLELDEALPRVPCALGSINQVLVNMIVNAAHAIGDVVKKAGATDTPALGQITIRTRAVAGYAEIDIEDTGSGMSDAIQARIFDPFFTTKVVGRGTGQGLAIAHRIIVGRHSGNIRVRSAVGTGTCFTIRLPLVREETVAGAA